MELKGDLRQPSFAQRSRVSREWDPFVGWLDWTAAGLVSWLTGLHAFPNKQGAS